MHVVHKVRSSSRLIQNQLTAKGAARLADALRRNTGVVEIW